MHYQAKGDTSPLLQLIEIMASLTKKNVDECFDNACNLLAPISIDSLRTLNHRKQFSFSFPNVTPILSLWFHTWYLEAWC